MTKDENLKKCFETIYKGQKFDYFEPFKKSRQYEHLSIAYDVILENALPTNKQAKDEAKKRLETRITVEEIKQFESMIEHDIGCWDDCITWIRKSVGIF